MNDDDEKQVISTFVRRLSVSASDRSVLYIHVFNDYFFQKELAHQFNDHFFNFYALDLRRYGRSVMHSEKSVTNMKDKTQLQTRDAILNIKDIKLICGNIKGDVEVIPIKGGLHDLILSQKKVRDHVYDVISKWIDIRFSQGNIF